VLLAPACVDCAPAQHGQAHWDGALAALEAYLDGQRDTRPHARLHVTLSNRLVRYAAVPWQPALSSQTEQLAYARDCMRQLYGAAAASWNLCFSPGGARRAGLASAIDAGLPEALAAVCARRAAVLATLRPQLMAVFNRYRRRLGRVGAPCAWLLAGDGDGLCGALFDQGGWRVARNLHAGEGWQAGLDTLLARETLLADPAEEVGRVWLWAPGDGAWPAQAAGWPLEPLAAPVQAGSHAWFALRLGIGDAV
jgi:hypothetical protein